GPALLVDIGSTTTDIIPLLDGTPRTTGATDPERLASGELVYTGVERSPICALVREAAWQGKTCPVAQEVFATTLDAYLILGEVVEDAHNTQTADRRPATRAAARDRLARMVCGDRTMFDEDDARAMSASVAVAQLQLITDALAKVIFRLPAAPNTVIISGRGEFIARRAVQNMQIQAAVVSLSSQLGPELSKCATAHALAVLAKEGPR
ncbi:MAG TPA: hydantoinase/oxoprolinase family protein, partial [Pirellulales bacterium]